MKPELDSLVPALAQGQPATASARPAALRLFWLLSGDESVASSRIQGYLIHRYLRERGTDSRLLLAPPFKLNELPWKSEDEALVARVCGTDIVVLQKLRGEAARSLTHTLRSGGAITLYIACDYRPEDTVAFECDVIACPSPTLARFYRDNGAKEVVEVPDPAEFWCERDEIRRRTGRDFPASPLKLCWVGHGTNWPTLEPLRALLREPEFADVELVTVSNHPEADVVWSLEAVRQTVRECDVGVVPTGSGFEQEVKSANRVVLFMALGVPVIAGRIPSYEQTVQHDATGLLADSPEEWRACLRQLRAVEERHRLAERAYDAAREQFSLDAVCSRWMELFQALNARPRAIPMAQPATTPRQKRALTTRLQAQAQVTFALELQKQSRPHEAGRALRQAWRALPLHPALAPEVVGVQLHLASETAAEALPTAGPWRRRALQVVYKMTRKGQEWMIGKT